ncbi:MAG: single-stranded DNA-binding protein [Planctomycetota bacterium]|nr:MAG: single-stranded DNA-binding protein [Planctomycetota bacterium]HIC23504.1 single-stranded DNA-binding protein [Planctomycetota bacterium]
MMELNKVFIVGNLTRDPELRMTSSGTAVCDLGLASNHRWRKQGEDQFQEETCFVSVTVWGRQAENCNQYLSKGSGVLVEGRLKYDQWDDKETGKARNKLTVVASSVQFMPKSGEGSGAGQGGSTASQGQQGSRETTVEFEQGPPLNDEVPF